MTLRPPLQAQDPHPLAERDDFTAETVAGLRITSQTPGVFNRPGSLAFSFTVRDAGGNFYPSLTGERLRVTCGSRRVTGLIFGTGPDGYTVTVPRLPYQEKNGAYDLRITIDPDGKEIGDSLPRSVLYQSPRLNLILVIDTSTSMRLNDPGNFRVAAVNSIVRYGRLLNIIDKVSIVGFSSSARALCPLTSIRNAAVVERAAGRIDSNGETNMADGLEAAYAELLKAGRNEHTIVILLTDGENNFPYDRQHLKFAALGVPVFTIGLTKNVNSAFLDSIARETRGEYYQVPDSFSVLAVYNRIVQDELGHRILVDEEVVLRPGQRTNVSLAPGLKVKKVNIIASWDRKKPTIRYPENSARLNISTFTDFQCFELLNPGARDKIRVENNTSSTGRFAVIGYVSSSLAIRCRMPKKTFGPGEPVEFTVLAWQDDKPLTGCSVAVSLSSKRTNMLLRLRDDGLHNDSAPQDGMYRNYAFDLPEGDYRAVFTVKGTDLFNATFRRTSAKEFTVSPAPPGGLKVVSGEMRFDRTGAGMEYFRSFRVLSGAESPVPIRVFSLPMSPFDGRTNIAVSVKPSHFVLEKDRLKLFNVSVVFPLYLASGIYSSRLVLIEEDRFQSIPFEADFYKYLIPQNPEKAK
jgi:hypothetical protein